MRVLILINGLGTGGAERSLVELLPRLVECGVEPLVVNFYRREEGVEGYVKSQGFDVRLIRERRLPARVHAVRRMLTTERVDLVHTTLFEAAVAGRLAAVNTGIPVLSSLVSTSYSAARFADPRIAHIKLAAVRLIDGVTARHLTAHFHAITQVVKDHAVSQLGVAPDRVTVIERGRDGGRLGVPGEARRHRVRDGLSLAQDTELVLTVGRHEFAKGQRYLIEAVTQLGRERPRLVLLVAGRRGHVSQDLERLRAQSGMRDRILFLGHRDDVPDLLAAADIFVFPSVYEGLGGALVEAMALGLPIVASDIPVFREVLEPGRNALLVAPASSSSLAAGLGELLDNPSRAREFGARSREIFESRFTLERCVDRTVELYRQLAKDP